jgi:carbamoyltransferase
MLIYSRWLREKTASPNLCLSGGVALNCVANSKIALEAGFDRVFVPPAPGDDGIAVGCALYGASLHGELVRGECKVFLGGSYPATPDGFEALGLSPVAGVSDIAAWVAQRIASGAVVGWYQGGAELGPRALGHRSFLADPRHPGMRDHLNKVVKNREPFRPFAPVIPEERVLEFFDQHWPSHYMSFVACVRADKRALVPAITHVDGTARYQVLRRSDNPELHAILEAFDRLTGIPMLLNTSFNRAGEPIVETPEEAARCVLAASAEILVVDGTAWLNTTRMRTGDATV